MSDIFISYASEDLFRAEALAQVLTGYGWSVFWDRTIPVGKTWRKVIEGELHDACCIIVVWTKASIKSDWVHEEADYAKRRGVLIPILVGDVQPPFGFRSVQAAQPLNPDGTISRPAIERLIGSITSLIGRNSDLCWWDFVRAFEEYQKAAVKGDPEAMHSLALLYIAGAGVSQSDEKALEWLEKAAAKGNAASMYTLGTQVEGRYLVRDRHKVREWLEKAASTRDERYSQLAKQALASLPGRR